jgi:hypothetical protein
MKLRPHSRGGLRDGAAYARSPRFLTRHPGPALMTLSAALAWLGGL